MGYYIHYVSALLHHGLCSNFALIPCGLDCVVLYLCVLSIGLSLYWIKLLNASWFYFPFICKNASIKITRFGVKWGLAYILWCVLLAWKICGCIYNSCVYYHNMKLTLLWVNLMLYIHCHWCASEREKVGGIQRRGGSNFHSRSLV